MCELGLLFLDESVVPDVLRPPGATLARFLPALSLPLPTAPTQVLPLAHQARRPLLFDGNLLLVLKKKEEEMSFKIRKDSL